MGRVSTTTGLRKPPTPAVRYNEAGNGELLVGYRVGEDVRELLRIRAEILAALERVNEVIARATAPD